MALSPPRLRGPLLPLLVLIAALGLALWALHSYLFPPSSPQPPTLQLFPR